MNEASTTGFTTSEAVSARMSRQRVKNTQPELAVRKALFAAGERFRIHYPVPGRTRCTIDVAFPRRRVAVFVDGCFWHGCPLHKSVPKSNAAAWIRKIDGNRRRDRDLDEHLRALSWTVIRVWEHDDPHRVSAEVRQALSARRSGR